MISKKEEIEEYFKDLRFEEIPHTYQVNGVFLSSVSAKIKRFYREFDAVGISERKAKREGTNAEELRAEWQSIADVACNFGTKVHLFGEDYPYDNTLIPSNNHEVAITKFWKELPPHLVPVMMEARMYHYTYWYSGTADIILWDTIDESFVIADYKTNKDLFKNFANQKMLAPFDHLLDTPHSHYQLQLSYYQLLLEQLGYRVSKRIIVYLKPDGNYEMYNTDDYTSELEKLLKIEKMVSF